MSSEEQSDGVIAAPGADGPRGLSRVEVLRALRTSNLEAIAATVHGSLTGGAFQTGFALFLGAGSFWMGVIGAVPTVAALVQLLSSVWVERRGERKALTAWFSLIARTLWLPILLIPWLLPRDLWLAAFVVLFAVSSLALQVPVPAFTSWLSDLVPADHRGRYFGRRNMLAGITTIAATVPPAWLMDHAIEEWGVSRRAMFAALFGAAVVFGVVSFLLLLRQPEPPMAIRPEARDASLRGMLALYARPMSDARFRRFLAFATTFAVGQFFAAPFFAVYALEDLKLGYTWLQLLGAAASLSALVAMPLWGYLSDRFGNKPLLTLAIVGVSLTPLPWLAANAEHRTAAVIILALNNLFGGAVWAGVGLLQFNMLIETTPAEGRSLYVGALSAASGIAGGAAPVLGGVLLEVFRATPLHLLGGTVISPYHVIFAINAVLRFMTLPLLNAVPAPSRATPRQVLGHLGSVRMSTIRQMRRLQHSGSETVRKEAVAALSDARSGLAVQELVLALGDPVLGVRREAARALGEIGDPEAVPALMALLREPASGVTREAAEALGRIGSEEALPGLEALLDRGSRSEQLAAIEAMGRIASHRAGPALLRALENALRTGQEDVAEAAVLAIGACLYTDAVPRLVELLNGAETPLRLALIRALGEIGDPSAGHAIEEVLSTTVEPALVTAACVALAECGRKEAAPRMFDALGRLESAAARRQVVNAIGALLGDDHVYRLLTADPMEREEAVERAILGLAKTARPQEQRARRRQQVLVRRAAQSYAEGDRRGAAQLIARLGSAVDPVAAALLDVARVRLREREPTEEEFLAILSAAGVQAREGSQS